jgi:hypothetical protein
MARVVVRTRLFSDELEALDALAQDRGLTRAATIRLLIARGLEQTGPLGSLTPYPPSDDGGWPASREVRIELVRRRLWDLSQAGSATATIALERALAREQAAQSVGDAETQTAAQDEFADLDALRERRRRDQEKTPGRSVRVARLPI